MPRAGKNERDPLHAYVPYGTYTPDIHGRAKRVFRPADGAGAGEFASDKKWLRTPVFGPGAVVCYECGHPHTVPYFGHLDACEGCGARRFSPVPLAVALEEPSAIPL